MEKSIELIARQRYASRLMSISATLAFDGKQYSAGITITPVAYRVAPSPDQCEDMREFSGN